MTFYDSRMRVRPALRKLSTQVGPFPINLHPVCLSSAAPMAPDIDATYIASKEEIFRWAAECRHSVEYPSGTDGQFRLHSYLVLTN